MKFLLWCAYFYDQTTFNLFNVVIELPRTNTHPTTLAAALFWERRQFFLSRRCELSRQIINTVLIKLIMPLWSWAILFNSFFFLSSEWCFVVLYCKHQIIDVAWKSKIGRENELSRMIFGMLSRLLHNGSIKRKSRHDTTRPTENENWTFSTYIVPTLDLENRYNTVWINCSRS